MKTLSQYLRYCTASLTLIFLLAPYVQAQSEGETLIKEARCNACHQMSETLLGPAYQAIAVRHGPRKEVMIDVLARKIVDGGGGNWGIIPMVPNQLVSIEEARIISAWILEQNIE